MKNPRITIKHAPVKDAEEILALQKIAYISEAEIYNDYEIPPLTQTFQQVLDDFNNYTVLKALSGGKIIGSVRGQITGEAVYIGRLMVHPDFQNKGFGTRLMAAIEAEFPQAKTLTLGTGHRSESNLYLYHKLGYKDAGYEKVTDDLTIVRLEKVKPKA